MSTNFTKQFFWSLGIFSLIFFSANTVFDFLWKNNVKSVTKPPLPMSATVTETPIFAPASEDIQLAFVGDLMLDRGVKFFVENNFAGDYKKLFANVQDRLQDYDLLFANLEGPISDKGNDMGSLYSFRFEPRVLPVLKEVGFDIFSLANNHTFNWGEKALADTMRLLTKSNIDYVGAGYGKNAYEEKILEARGLKIGFLAFSEFKDGGVSTTSAKYGLALMSKEEIKRRVAQAKTRSDLIIVSFHSGEEYQIEPNAFQEKYAKLAIDAGADLIVGHHPHVVQTLEKYKNTYIAYSLGNFIFDQYFSPETMQGGLLEVNIDPEAKIIKKVELKKVQLNKFYQIESIE